MSPDIIFISVCVPRFCMVYSEVPNFSEPNPELLAQGNQQNKSVSIFTQNQPSLRYLEVHWLFSLPDSVFCVMNVTLNSFLFFWFWV